MNKKDGLVSGDMMQKQQFDTKTLRRLLRRCSCNP